MRKFSSFFIFIEKSTCADPEECREPGLRLKKNTHKIKGFLAILVRPEKITKLPSQQSMLGHHWHASETPFKWRFAGGPMMARFYWYLDSPSPHQHKKTLSKVDHSDKHSGHAHMKYLTYPVYNSCVRSRHDCDRYSMKYSSSPGLRNFRPLYVCSLVLVRMVAPHYLP